MGRRWVSRRARLARRPGKRSHAQAHPQFRTRKRFGCCNGCGRCAAQRTATATAAAAAAAAAR
eukprot:5210132-Prymnesium_polylepis.1